MIRFILLTALTLIIISCTSNDVQKQAVAYNNKAISYSDSNLDSALFYFDKAIKADSTYLLSYQNKTNLYTKIGNYESALQTLEMLSQKINNSEINKMKGLLNDLLDNSEKAKIFYDKSIAQIDEESKRVNDFEKYKKLYSKGTLFLLQGKEKDGLQLIDEYYKKANISTVRKDSVVAFMGNKQDLLKLLINP